MDTDETQMIHTRDDDFLRGLRDGKRHMIGLRVTMCDPVSSLPVVNCEPARRSPNLAALPSLGLHDRSGGAVGSLTTSAEYGHE